MNKSDGTTKQPQKSLAKGLIAGAVGGLIGAVAMAVVERMLPHPANEQPEQVESIHWGFGAAIGAAYGVVAEFYPAATTKEGATFGMALEGLAQRGALPMLGKPLPADNHAAEDVVTNTTSRVVFGITTETVRGFIRPRL